MATSGNCASAPIEKPAKHSREQNLAQNDGLLRLLVDSVRDYAIFLVDPEGRVASWNQGAETIHGYARGEILGRDFSFLYPNDASDSPARHLETALSIGHFVEQGWRVRKDGSRFWADVAITPLMDEDRGLRGFAHITRDVTEVRVAEQELRNSEQKYPSMVSASKDYAILMLDPHGHVVTWNEGAERIKGYKAAEIIGQHFSRFYLQEAVRNGWPDCELQLAAQQGHFSGEGWRVRKDGSTFWASVVITPLRDENGELYGFSKVTRDMTERWDREQRIQHLNRELQERVSQLAESQRMIEARTMELRKLTGQLLRLQDEERRRIARELHDDLGQELVALKMMLEATGDKSSSKQAMLELADGAIQTVHNLSYLLHPPLLDEAGLLPSLL